MPGNEIINTYRPQALFLQLSCWLAIAVITAAIIIWTFSEQWHQVGRVVYSQAEPEPVAVSLEGEDEPTLVIEPLPEPTATFSADFVNDLIRAVLDASSAAQATSEAQALLEQEFD